MNKTSETFALKCMWSLQLDRCENLRFSIDRFYYELFARNVKIVSIEVRYSYYSSNTVNLCLEKYYNYKIKFKKRNWPKHNFSQTWINMCNHTCCLTTGNYTENKHSYDNEFWDCDFLNLPPFKLKSNIVPANNHPTVTIVKFWANCSI